MKSNSLTLFRKQLYLLLLTNFIGLFTLAQCYNPGGNWDFEIASLTGPFFAGTEGNGTIELTSADKYSGNKSLKATINVAGGWQSRIFTQDASCNFTKAVDEYFVISFYAKGEIGDEITVALMTGGSVDEQKPIILSSTDWKHYTIALKSTAASSQGKIKLIFKDAGTYFVDLLELNAYDCNGDAGGSANIDDCGICSGGNTGIPPINSCTFTTILPNNANLLFEGTLEQDVSASKATFYRMKKDYVNNPLAGYYSLDRAASSSGVVVRFKTKSPIVKIYFQEDIVKGVDTYWHTFDIYKNGKYHRNDQGFTIELSNPKAEMVEWSIALPVFSIIELLKLELITGHSLESISKTKPIYVAIGNSITHGTGIESWSTRLTYPFIVADSLNYEVYNWGIGGSKIHDTIVSNFVPGFAPDLITILWGYNDVHAFAPASDMTTKTLPMYENILTRLAQKFPNTCIMAILSTYTNTPNGQNGKTIPDLRTNQRTIVENLQSTYSNISYMYGDSYTDASGLDDDVHLNENGNASLANGIITELSKCGIYVGTSEVKNSNRLIYPNPTSGVTQWKTKAVFQLFNTQGKLILSGYESQADLSHLAKGIYYLKIENKTTKIIKK